MLSSHVRPLGRSLVAFLGMFVVTGWGASCGGGATQPLVPAQVEFTSADTLFLMMGATEQLSARVLTAAGQQILTATPTFVVQGGSGAVSVEPDGRVKALRPGVATVAVQLGSLSATRAIGVIGHPAADAVARKFATFSGLPYAIAVSSRDEILVTLHDIGFLVKLDTTGATMARSATGVEPTDVKISSNGSIAVVTNQLSRTLGFHDVGSILEVGRTAVAADPFRVALSRDGSRVFASMNTGELALVDGSTRQVSQHTTLRGALNGIALGRDDATLYVTSMAGELVSLDPSTLAERRRSVILGTLQEVVASQDGHLLFVATESAGTVYVVDASTLAVLETISVSGGVFGLALSPDGTQVFASLSFAGRVAVIDVETRRLLRELNVGGTPRRLAFDRFGGRVFEANEGGWIDLIR